MNRPALPSRRWRFFAALAFALPASVAFYGFGVLVPLLPPDREALAMLSSLGYFSTLVAPPFYATVLHLPFLVILAAVLGLLTPHLLTRLPRRLALAAGAAAGFFVTIFITAPFTAVDFRAPSPWGQAFAASLPESLFVAAVTVAFLLYVHARVVGKA